MPLHDMRSVFLTVLLNRLSLTAHQSTSSRLLIPTARYSFQAFFRSKREKEAEKKFDSEAKAIWSDAVREFKQTNLIEQLEQSSPTLTRTQLRRIKKQAFLHAIDVYMRRHGKTRRGYHQFVKNAMEQMNAYEVAGDLDCYKAILRVFPVKRMVVTTFLQAELGHFPRQQDTLAEIMNKMGANNVMADDEVGQMIINIFGWRSHAMQHYREMMYWYPKLARLNPWPVKWGLLDDLDADPLKLARLIAERICPDRNTELHVVQLKDADVAEGKPRSMISAQSPEQRAMLKYALYGSQSDPAGRKKQPVFYIDGPNSVWYERLQAAYYTLWTDVDQKRILHSSKLVVYRELINSHSDMHNFPVFGHADPRLEAPKVAIDLLAPPTNNNLPQICFAGSESEMVPVDMNAAALDEPTPRVPRCQPEYDGRWQSLRRSHVYKFIPSDLSVHEQLEGTILATAVVTPVSDAMVNQKLVYGGMIADELNPDTDGSSIRKCDYPPLPAPAPSSLIRAWVAALQQHNPCLSDATIVIRVQPDGQHSSQSSDQQHQSHVGQELDRVSAQSAGRSR